MRKHILLAALLAATSPSLAHAQTTPKPVITRDIDRPTAQPVYAECTAGFPYPGPNGSNFRTSCELYRVPTGKLLVIETANVAGALYDASGSIQGWGLGTDPKAVVQRTYPLDPPMLRADPYGTYWFFANRSGRFSYPAGAVVLGRVQGFGIISYEFSIAGYLVDGN